METVTFCRFSHRLATVHAHYRNATVRHRDEVNRVCKKLTAGISALFCVVFVSGAKVSDTIRKGIIDINPYENNTGLLMVGNVAALSGKCDRMFAVA